jgi:hypothetical protein
MTEREAREVLRHIKTIAELARASGRCDDTFHFLVHLEEHDAWAHDEMQTIRALLGLPPLVRKYHLPT